jgi:hypothetical protein
LQWDYAAGPVVEGRRVVLFCAWLAWSRFRVVVPLRDRTMPSVIAALDATFRVIGGAPTFALTDNEKTVTDRHIAGIAVRNPQIVAVARYYGLTVATCVPADPESKGGAESTVRLAKADLVPTDHNLRDDYMSWDELVAACAAFMDKVNGRVHRITNRRPVDMLTEEQSLLHAVPTDPFTAAFGETRAVGWASTFNYLGARYSVARHRRVPAGQTSIIEAHYPNRRDPLIREPKARTGREAAFLALGAGAGAWLVEAAGCGARHIETRMAEAIELAKVFDPGRVDRALGIAAVATRFAPGDLLSILSTSTPTDVVRASETHSLQPGTSVWSRITGPTTDIPNRDAHDDDKGRS